MTVTVSKQTARRYVLGKQGLWPGRRWRSEEGTARAIRNSECVQIDTISAVARSHDLHLFSRVVDYEPALLDRLMYGDRLFFDFGSILMVYPADELPYWRAVMRWQRDRLCDAMEARMPVVEHVRQEIAARGPLASRDFTNRERVRGGFDMVKDSAVALYLLWLSGEIATHSRRGFDRVYDLACNVAGADGEIASAGDAEAEAYFALKAVRDLGLASAAEWLRRVRVYLHRSPAGSAAKILEAMEETGLLVRVEVESDARPRWAIAEDAPVILALAAGAIPDAWRPIGPTTEEEANFLAPLDNVIWDRARTRGLFDFEYVWEVYKPAHLRKWGYYTLPILWGDRLVARFASRLNRKTRTLVVEGFWVEDESLGADPAFIAALAAGMRRFCRFHQAAGIDAGQMNPLLGAQFTVEADS